VGLIGINTYLAHRNEYDTGAGYQLDFPSILKYTWQAKIGLGTIIVLLGGIFLGYFTPSEAAAVAIVYILFTSLVTKRLTDIKQVTEAIFTSLRLNGTLIPTVVFAVLIQQNLSFIGLQRIVSDMILSLGSDWLIITAIIVILLVTGSTLSSVPNLVLTAPLLAGAASEIGLTPIVWGIVFMMSDSIGFITPPYGINLFVISGITDIDYIQVAYRALPYLIICVFIWILFLTVPEINLLAG
jgi:C4-dicarboxylate transporter DctM subunit